MGDSDGLTDSEIRRIVREELSSAGRSVLSTVFWTVLAVFAALVGLQTIQVSLYAIGLVSVVLAATGLLVVGSSAYLLYLLYWA
ncbi:hypothetical protein [Halorussus salinus]|uniref:hypothetical protein n=1 Tax=Halorussus salinus TaxID=1364935 RepID=UPI001092AC85|nr:hypothetical protein [Halorussus salinus]